MRRVAGRLTILLAAVALLAAAGVFAYRRQLPLEPSPLPPSGAADASPHAPDARHPAEVARIMARLPAISATASLEEIIAFLGLPTDWNGGSVSSTHCTMTWDVAPGYRFALSFDPVRRDGKRTLEFSEAGFAAQKKPGFPPHEYHTVYPYRSLRGMLYE